MIRSLAFVSCRLCFAIALSVESVDALVLISESGIPGLLGFVGWDRRKGRICGSLEPVKFPDFPEVDRMPGVLFPFLVPMRSLRPGGQARGSPWIWGSLLRQSGKVQGPVNERIWFIEDGCMA